MMQMLCKLVRVFEKRFNFLKYIPEYGKLLDCGCGDFASSYKMMEFRKDIEWHAIDLYKSEKIPKEVIFNILNLEKELLPFADETFDGIILLHVMEHIDNIDRICSEIKRVLRRGGYVYIEVPSTSTLKAPTSKKFFYMTGNFYDDKTHKQVFSLKLLSDIISNHMDMKVVEIGTAKNILKILLFPIVFIYSIIKWKAYFMSSVGDFFGYRLYVVGTKQ